MSSHGSSGATPDGAAGFSAENFELVKQGAREDDVEILVYEPRFPRPGSRLEKRVERRIAAQLLLAGLFATAFVVIYIIWPNNVTPGVYASQFYTPLLGFTLGFMLLFIGIAVITWAKHLLPREVSVQQRHLGSSPVQQQAMTAASLRNMADEIGLKRRPILKFGLLGLLPVGAAAIIPLGALIKNPHQDNAMITTGWNPKNNDGNPVPVTRDDGTPIYPQDVSVGGQLTVFPGIPGGATEKWADSPTLLIHLRDQDANALRKNLININEGSMWTNFVAYSKICTHLGCPASLYNQQTNILLCPCHQSQFLITDNALPIFGPATHRLPMLPLGIDPVHGYFVATADFKKPIGPGFWERP